MRRVRIPRVEPAGLREHYTRQIEHAGDGTTPSRRDKSLAEALVWMNSILESLRWYLFDKNGNYCNSRFFLPSHGLLDVLCSNESPGSITFTFLVAAIRVLCKMESTELLYCTSWCKGLLKISHLFLCSKLCVEDVYLQRHTRSMDHTYIKYTSILD